MPFKSHISFWNAMGSKLLITGPQLPLPCDTLLRTARSCCSATFRKLVTWLVLYSFINQHLEADNLNKLLAVLFSAFLDSFSLFWKAAFSSLIQISPFVTLLLVICFDWRSEILCWAQLKIAPCLPYPQLNPSILWFGSRLNFMQMEAEG